MSRSDRTAILSAKDFEACMIVYNKKAPTSLCTVRPNAVKRASKLIEMELPLDCTDFLNGDPVEEFKRGSTSSPDMSSPMELAFGKSGRSGNSLPLDSHRLSFSSHSDSRNGLLSSSERLLLATRSKRQLAMSAKGESLSHNTSFVLLWY